MGTKIVANGREYGSVDEMPEDVRRLYQSALARLADQGHSAGPNPPDNVTVQATFTSKLIVNGKEYRSLDELPPLVRDRYQEAMARQLAKGGGSQTTVTMVRTGLRKSTVIAIIVIALLAALALGLLVQFPSYP